MGVLYFISRITLRRLLTAPALQGEGRDRVAAVVRGFPKPLGVNFLEQCLAEFTGTPHPSSDLGAEFTGTPHPSADLGAEFTGAPHLYVGLGARNFKAGPGVQVSGRSWRG